MPAPLDGMGQPPYQQPQAQRVEVIPGPLICVSPGRFREDMSSGGNTGSEAPLSDPVVIPASQKAVDLHEPSDRGQAYTYGDASASGREPSQEKQSYEEEEDFLGEEKARSGIGIGALIERAVTAVLLVVLVVLVLVILLAWFSARANGLIFNILHIDIRDEIAYLLLLMKNLH